MSNFPEFEAMVSRNQFDTITLLETQLKDNNHLIHFVTIPQRLSAVNYYHKALHLGYCSSPKSTSIPGYNYEYHNRTEKRKYLEESVFALKKV